MTEAEVKDARYWATYPLEVMDRGHVLNDEELRLMCACLSETLNRAEAAEAERDRLRHIVARIPDALNRAFSAGTEEREGGSARRQDKDLDVVDRLRKDARAALTDTQEDRQP